MNYFSYLRNYIVRDIILYIMEDYNIAWDEAMQIFFTSTTYEKLSDPETGMYIEGSAYIYELFKDEHKYGHFGHYRTAPSTTNV